MADHMRLALMWTLQTQFAGYVLARDDELPELELLPRDPARGPIRELLDGRAEYGVASPAHLLNAGRDARELVLVALFMARSPVRLAGLRATVGDRISPRPGLRVGVWPGEDSELRAILRSEGVDTSEVEFVPVLDEVGALLGGDVDYVQCTTYNELPAIVAAAGGESHVVAHDPAAWGVDVPKDGLVVRRDVLEAEPLEVAGLVRAAIGGWRRTLADPREAAAQVCRSVPGLDLEPQYAQLVRLVELFDSAHPLGEPRPADVARAVHCAAVAGLERDPEDVRVDRGPWERASA
jgi:ABC-type nitrate/sulfonate/bicarbonate transport system substrate-binding protein